MRIKREFKKHGYFWLPSAPDKKFPGTLSVSDGGIIDLEIVELFESVDSYDLDGERWFWDILNWEPTFGNHFKRIVGHIETSEVTLDGCKFNAGNSYNRTGLSKSLLRVDRVFTGIKYDGDEIPRFKILIFSVAGIDKWIGKSKIDIEKLAQGEHISFQHPEEVSFTLANGMELSIAFKKGRSSSLSPREDRITQRTYFKLVSQDVRELDEFISVVEKVLTFLCFAIGDIICLDSIEGTSQNPPPLPPIQEDFGYDRIGLLPINIFYSSQLYSKDTTWIGFNTLFKYERIQNDAERIICNWIKAYKQIAPAFDLYFLAQMRTQPSLEVTFLMLITGLEAFHRRTSNEKHMDEVKFKAIRKTLVNKCPKSERDWFAQKLNYANELSLRNRIEKMIDPFNRFIDDGRKSGLIDSIVHTRNYLTHYDLNLESKAAKDQDLHILCLKIEALLQLHFLKLIGFNDQEINDIAEYSDIKRKCDM